MKEEGFFNAANPMVLSMEVQPTASEDELTVLAYRCPDASVMGPVTLEGWELLFRRGGFATIAPKEGEKVHGLLWSITPGCEQSLDRYEG